MTNNFNDVLNVIFFQSVFSNLGILEYSLNLNIEAHIKIKGPLTEFVLGNIDCIKSSCSVSDIHPFIFLITSLVAKSIS